MNTLSCDRPVAQHKDYFTEAISGYSRNYDSSLKYMRGNIMGDSASISKYKVSRDSMTYFIGAMDYAFKIKWNKQ